jgi:hypothetical protein
MALDNTDAKLVVCDVLALSGNLDTVEALLRLKGPNCVQLGIRVRYSAAKRTAMPPSPTAGATVLVCCGADQDDECTRGERAPLAGFVLLDDHPFEVPVAFEGFHLGAQQHLDGRVADDDRIVARAVAARGRSRLRRPRRAFRSRQDAGSAAPVLHAEREDDGPSEQLLAVLQLDDVEAVTLREPTARRGSCPCCSPSASASSA